MTLKQQIALLVQAGVDQAKDADFMALAFLYYMDCRLSLSIQGNGFMDDDKESSKAMYRADVAAFVDEICARRS